MWPRNSMLQLFADDLNESSLGFRTVRPQQGFALDVVDGEKGYRIHVDVPGIPKENVKINLSRDNVLTLEGERQDSVDRSEDGYIRRERFYGSFHRSIQLPDDVDTSSIRAKHADGVLDIELPKKDATIESESTPITIE